MNDNAEAEREIVAIEKELDELKARIDVLGNRLAAGDTTVRAELNPAIRRERELGKRHFELETALGRVTPGEILYGPPWMLRGDAGPPEEEQTEFDHQTRRPGFWARLAARLFRSG